MPRTTLAALAALFLTLHLPAVAEPPGRDAGVFGLVGWRLVTDGEVPYRDTWDHKPPLVHALHGVALGATGGWLGAPTLLEVLTQLLAMLLLALAVARSRGQRAAAIVAVLYAALAQAPFWGGFWNRGQAEGFLDLPLAAALFVAAGPAGPIARGLAVGAGAAAAFLLKFPLVLTFVPVAVAAAARLDGGRPRTLAAAAAAAAFAGPVGGAALALHLAGAGPEAWDALVVFNAGHAGLRPEGLGPLDWLAGAFPAAGTLAAVYAVAALGAVAAARRSAAGFLALPAALWLASFLSAAVQGKFWSYHLIVLALPVALTAGTALDELLGHEPGALAAGVLGVAAMLAPVAVDAWAYVAEHRLPGYLAGSVPRGEVLMTYRWRPGDNFDSAAIEAAAAAVRLGTAPDERIFIWGFEPLIYLRSERRPASRFVFHYPLYSLEPSPLRERLRAALEDDLRRDPPALVLVGVGGANSLEPAPAARLLDAQPTLVRLLARDYQPAETVGGWLIMRRRSAP